MRRCCSSKGIVVKSVIQKHTAAYLLSQIGGICPDEFIAAVLPCSRFNNRQVIVANAADLTYRRIQITALQDLHRHIITITKIQCASVGLHSRQQCFLRKCQHNLFRLCEHLLHHLIGHCFECFLRTAAAKQQCKHQYQSHFFHTDPPQKGNIAMTQHLVLLYLIIINASALTLMLADKLKAKRGAWRIPEATLMGVAAMGGSIGALIGMYWFRHKTRHLKFTLGIPLILAVQIILVIFLMA